MKNTATYRSRAVVQTLFATSYIKRLCRHFAHKVPVTVTEQAGLVQFPFGSCRMDASDEYLSLRIETLIGADLGNAEKVITDHLIRMANRDKPEVIWKREISEPGEILQ